MLGRVFSVTNGRPAEEAQEDSAMANAGNDAALGLLLDKYGEDSTMMAGDSSDESELEKDDEVTELREALNEMVTDFKRESGDRATRLDKEVGQHAEFNTLISKIKMQGMN